MSDAVLRFTGVDAGLSAQFARALSQLKSLGDSADKTTSAIDKGFKVAAGAVAAISFTQLAREAFELAESLEIASARTGIQIEALQRLQFIAGQSETSVDAITTSINKFQINLATGNDKAAQALDRLGISIGEINALAPDEQFLRIASSVAEIQSPAERAATAVALFGKGGAELLPLLRKGADGVAEISAQFDEFGVTLSSQTISSLDDAGDAVGRMTGSIKALSAELISFASPAIVGATDGITTFFKALAFGLRGEGGGHGENAISNLDQDIQRVRDQLSLLGSADATSGGFFDWFRELGGQGRKNDELTRLNAELRELTRHQQVLTGTGLAGISPILPIDTDVLKTRAPAAVRTAGATTTPTGQDIRERGGLGETDPQIIRAQEAKDLELQISQEKFDALLKQQTDYANKVLDVDTDLAEFRRATRETFGLQEVTFERAKNETILSLATGIFGVLARENSKVAKIQQALAVATVIYDTSRAVMKAFAEVPYPANIGVAAFAAAQGAIQIAKIKSTNYTGGGGGGGSISGVSGGVSSAGREVVTGTSVGANSAQPGAIQKAQTTINVYGWSEAAIRDLVRRIKDEVGDHDLNLIRNT
jgi:hypothetical protein